MSDLIFVDATPQVDLILVDSVQGAPGTASISVSGTGFVHVTSSTLDGAARAVGLASPDVSGVLPVANGGTALSAVGANGSVLGVTAGAFAFLTTLAATLLPVLSLTGDVTGSSTIGTASIPTTVGKIQGVAVPVPPGAGTTVLTDTSGVLSWAAASGSSVTGTGLWYSAGGALNTAAVTLSGDVTPSALSGGNLPLKVLQAQSGALVFNSDGSMSWAIASNASIAQLTTSSTIQGASLTLTPQASLNATNNGGGSLVVQLQVPNGSGAEAIFGVYRGTSLQGAIGSYTGSPTNGLIWLGLGTTPPSTSNWAIAAAPGGSVSFNGASGMNFDVALSTVFCVSNVGVQFFNGAATAFGGGAGVIGITNASTAPSSNPSGGGVLYASGGGAFWRGSLGAVSTVAASGSSLTVNSQAQQFFQLFGTCETVSSATPTTILTIATATGIGGMLSLYCSSRATTAGTGIAAGDYAFAYYQVGYRNIGGTVTMTSSGLVNLNGAGSNTTASALTSPVLTVSVATNVITLKVTNVALCTIDSQLYATLSSC